jgi:ABC-type siderophore export system fused ATPase/permease subunit
MLEFSHVAITVPLVSLTVAKQHLRITDTAHDADIQQKLDAAQAEIVARLSAAVDPAWTVSTVPKPVQHAILILTSALYEVRGGEDPAENMRKTWDAIEQLLAVHRDPTLA